MLCILFYNFIKIVLQRYIHGVLEDVTLMHLTVGHFISGINREERMYWVTKGRCTYAGYTDSIQTRKRLKSRNADLLGHKHPNGKER